MSKLSAIKIWSALPTPLTPDFRVDEPSVERVIQAAVRDGINGVFLAGTCGEGPWLPERRIVAGLAGIGLEAGERAAHLREPVGLLGPQLFAALLSGPEQIVLAFALQESFGQGVLSGVELALQLPVLDAVHGLVLQPGGLPASCTAEPPANSRYVPAAPCRGTPGRCPTTRRGPRADQWQPRCHR